MRLYGALPVYDRTLRPDYSERNALTFRHCEWLFDVGEGVAIFPEGVSRTDRTLLPLKHGAARLALSYAGSAAASSFAMIPVGLYYSNRTAFRSDVTVSVGEPIDRSKILAWGSGEGEEAVRGLTARIADALRAVLLEVADPRKVALLSVLEPIAAPASGSLDLESVRALAGRIAELERGRPLEYAQLERTARAFERARRSLRVSSRALAEPRNGDALRRRASLVAGAPPALIGAVLHALPVALTRAVTRRYASDPSQAAFARIASAFWLYALAVAGGAIVLFAVLGHTAWLLILLPTALLSGIFLIAYSEWARSEWEAWRLARMERRHLALVSRARRLRGWLRAFLAVARSEEPHSPRGATP